MLLINEFVIQTPDMKKISASLITFTIGINLAANVIAMTHIMLSELYFDNSGNWKLEIEYYDVGYGLTIDSMFLYSGTDTVRLPVYSFIKNEDVFVITADSLESGFRINRDGDCIQLIVYLTGGYAEGYEGHSLAFGNHPQAVIGAPRQDQSLARYWYHWVKTNSPSIGYPNDTTGMCGTLKGVIYDKYSTPVSNKTFKLLSDIEIPFETSETGEFSVRALSMPTQLEYIIQRGEQSSKSISIEDLTFDMEPDSVVFRDIYLQDDLITGIPSPSAKNGPVRVYPNPLPATGKLTIEIDLPVLTADIRVEIASLDGKMILQEKITDSKSIISMPEQGGIFIITVLLEKQRIWSGRVIVQ